MTYRNNLALAPQANSGMVFPLRGKALSELNHTPLPVPEAHVLASPCALDEPLDILLVEDVTSDAVLTKISLDATRIPYCLTTLSNGDQVQPYLRDRQRKRPDLVMLDLGLPGMNGFELLATFAANPFMMRAVPIVILTAHKHLEYLRKSYPLQIMSYITKPCSVENMSEMLTRVYTSRHPPQRAPGRLHH
jgi:CheY-like chemotaxis protein